ncbi:MAG: hypothetical protein CVU87_05150 [Firmicutes bacterium HGW-Firmicutes-12]|jgi:hypothetical protein|nr:MAG: hypothetical protein CVU87_05150 [Firmicutes bacterium HGW-Firmicutes-12]
MINKNCNIIRELLPLYAENLVSVETAVHIKEHLSACEPCSQQWTLFSQPLPDPLTREKPSHYQGLENKLFTRLKRTITVVLLLLIVGGAGLSYASYNAGKHIGMDDPSYRFAQELQLFTDIKETKTIGDYQVTLDNGLFDGTRSVIFISFSKPCEDMPQVSLTDENGNQYNQKSGKGWQNKFFMLEFEPLNLDTQQVTVFLSLTEQGIEGVEFTFPVDVFKTAQYTTIIYPNQEKELPELKITLEKVVLGVSETEFNLQFDWPVDDTVAGLGLGRGTAYFPTSIREAPTTPPPPGLGAPPPGGLSAGYAASYGVYYRPQDPPVNRPVLYDLTEREEVIAEAGEYRTTQFPCQVEAILKFAPVKQDTQQMELVLPPIYLYKKVEGIPQLYLNFENQNELILDERLSFSQGEVLIEKAWLEENAVYISYQVEALVQADNILPHFELADAEGRKQGILHLDREKADTIRFSLYDKELQDFYLSLDSIGELLSREKFTLDLQK